MFFFPDSAIVLQSDGVGDSTSVKENTSLLTGHPETSSAGLINRPISGQFDDFSSGDNSLEKILPEETDKNSDKMEKNDSGIAEEIDSESSSIYGFSNGEVHVKDSVNFIAISNISYEDNGNGEDSEEEKGE